MNRFSVIFLLIVAILPLSSYAASGEVADDMVVISVTGRQVTTEWYFSDTGRYEIGAIEVTSVYGNRNTIEFATLSIDCGPGGNWLIPNLKYAFISENNSRLKTLQWWETVQGEPTVTIGKQVFKFGRVTEPRPLAHPFMLSNDREPGVIESFLSSIAESKEPIVASFRVPADGGEREIELSVDGFYENLSKLKQSCFVDS